MEKKKCRNKIKGWVLCKCTVCLFSFRLHECLFHSNNFPLWWNLSHTCQNVSSTWQDQCGCPAVWKCNIVFIVNFTSLEIINDLKAHKHLPNQNHLGPRMWVHCFYGLLQLKSTIFHLQNSLLNISSVEKAKVWAQMFLWFDSPSPSVVLSAISHLKGLKISSAKNETFVTEQN